METNKTLFNNSLKEMFQLVHYVDNKYLGGIESILVAHLRGVDPVSTHELVKHVHVGFPFNITLNVFLVYAVASPRC